MPVDERLAWGFVRVPYLTVASPFPHRFEISINELESDGSWTVPYLLETTIEDTLGNLLILLDPLLPNGTTFEQFTVFKNNPLPTPTSFWYLNDVSETTYTGDGTAPVVASAQQTVVMKTSTARPSKLVILDGAVHPRPQRFPYASAPADAKALMDYLRDHGNIVSRDGESVTLNGTFNMTFNNRLRKKYGRFIEP